MVDAARSGTARATTDELVGTSAVVDPSELRRVLGHFATGVVVVATDGPAGRHGFAANSFTSVSLDPPLVLFCAAMTSTTWPRLREAGRFAVSVLGADSEEVGRAFARRGVDRFAVAPWSTSAAGMPVIADALAWLDCTLEAVHPAGDHELALCRVQALSATDAVTAEPLVFFRGRFGRLPAGSGAAGDGSAA